MSVLKETIKFYREKKAEERQKKMLVEKAIDLGIFEQFIQRVNENPDLRIDIHFRNGTTLNMKCYHKRETHDLINGEIYEDVR